MDAGQKRGLLCFGGTRPNARIVPIRRRLAANADRFDETNLEVSKTLSSDFEGELLSLTDAKASDIPLMQDYALHDELWRKENESRKFDESSEDDDLGDVPF